MNLQQRKERDIATIASIIRVALIFAMVATLVYFGFKAFLFMIPVMLGLILAKAASSSSRWILSKVRRQTIDFKQSVPRSDKKGRKLAVLFYFLFFMLFGILVFFLISFLIGLFAQLASKIPNLIGSASIMDTVITQFENVSERLGGLLDKGTVSTIEDALKNLQTSAIESLPQLLTKVVNVLTGFFSSIPRIILIFVVTIMSGYYFITQSDRLYSWLLRLIPDKQFVSKIFTASSNLASTLLRIGGGYIILLFLTFVQAYAGMLIFSVPNALLWAAVCAVVDILPVLGISFTLIPMGIVLIMGGDIVAGVGILGLYVIMMILRRFIEPLLIGNAMRLHPMTMVLAMIAGIAVLGLGGVLVAPFACVVALEIYTTFELEEKVRNAIGDLLRKNKDDENINQTESEQPVSEPIKSNTLVD